MNLCERPVNCDKRKRKKVKHENLKINAEKVLLRDGYKCVLCGSKWNIQIHHIVARSKCNKDKRMNSVDNLVTLCRDCHYVVHHAPNDYPDLYKRKLD